MLSTKAELSERGGKMTWDLDGEHGNVFYILRLLQSSFEKSDIDKDFIDQTISDLKATGDYHKIVRFASELLHNHYVFVSDDSELIENIKNAGAI